MEDNKRKRKQKHVDTNLRIFLLKKIIYNKEQGTYSDILGRNCSDDLIEELEQKLNENESKRTETNA